MQSFKCIAMCNGAIPQIVYVNLSSNNLTSDVLGVFLGWLSLQPPLFDQSCGGGFMQSVGLPRNW